MCHLFEEKALTKFPATPTTERRSHDVNIRLSCVAESIRADLRN